MKANIVVLPGDGIGPEVTEQGVRVLQAIAKKFGHQFDTEQHLIGGAAIDATGSALPTETENACKQADAVLLGAVGGPKWSAPEAKVRPEQGLLAIRKSLGLFANLRPVTLHPALMDASTIKPEVLKGTDIMVVRELTGGIYFGEKTRTPTSATDVCTYTVPEVERIVRLGARLACERRGHTLACCRGGADGDRRFDPPVELLDGVTLLGGVGVELGRGDGAELGEQIERDRAGLVADDAP